MAEQLSGLARILSNQPLPLTPMFRTDDPTRIAAEMEQFIRNLYAYLAELFGQLTAENLITTINQGGGFGFDKVVRGLYFFDGSDAGPFEYTLDSSIDWRECGILFFGRTAATLSDLKNNILTTDPELLQGSATSYSKTLLQVGDGASEPTGLLEVASDGKLKFTISNPQSPSSDSGYIYVWAAAFGRIGSTTVTTLGNGL
jgi:hypothetical protein